VIRPSDNPGEAAARQPANAFESASRGDLPGWAIVTPERRQHIARVAALMDEWAVNLELPLEERSRWRAAAWLHDSLRDADPAALRRLVGAPFDTLADPLLHGPAAATMLEHEGITDQALLLAVGYHTIGHPEFDVLGRALYLADFLEPGRSFDVEWRGQLRVRMPTAMSPILIEVAAARIGHLIETRRPVRPETVIFWNRIIEG
jgi:HD superfamily phosphohydrolase YqeK